MKKWLLAAVLLLAFSALPSPGTELGKLHPVSVLLVESGEKVTVETDTGQSGAGESLPDALRNLSETTPGHIFLDTVEYLVLQGSADSLIPDLRQLLRPGVRVCTTGEETDPAELAEYLPTHAPGTRLSEIDAGMHLPEIRKSEGRLILEE